MVSGETPAKDTISAAGVALILLVGIGWGINWVAIKVAVTEVSPWTFRAWCLVVGSAGMLALVRIRVGRLRFPRRHFWPILALALLNVTGFQMCVAFGLSMMEATRGVILGHTQPLWVVLFGAFVLRETVTRARTAGLVLGLAAMALLIVPDMAAVGAAPWGAMLVVAAAVMWGLGTVLFKHFDLPMTAVELTAWQLVFGGAPILVGALILDPLPDLSGLSTPAIVAMLYSAFVAQWFVQWAWYGGLQLLPATAAAIGSLSIPVVGLFASAWLLGEGLTWIELAALGLVLISICLVLIGPIGLQALRRSGDK